MSAPRRVMFVCIENSNRSQVAEAFAWLRASGRIDAYCYAHVQSLLAELAA